MSHSFYNSFKPLAIADFVYCLGLPVMAVELFNHRQWILGSGGCKLMSGILLLNLYGSVYFLSTISVGEFKIA